MNIQRKGTTVLQCIKCPHTYMKIGEIATIRLGHPRRPHRNASGTDVLKGTCPAHERERTNSL